MKKTVILTLLFVLVGFTYHPGKASLHGIPLKEYQSLTLYTETSNLKNYEMLKEIIFLPESKFNESAAAQMIERVNQIDDIILQGLVDQGVVLKLFTGLLTDEPTASYLKGKKPRGYSETGPTWDNVPGIGGSEVVLAKIGHSEKGQGHGSINLELHELAHSIDKFVFDSISEDPYFQSIWKKEVKQLFPERSYFSDYPEEYFAEVFAMYYLSSQSRNQLQHTAPVTYQFFLELSETQQRIDNV
ncbi:anthrax toxin lethal factor-related metalloendopeptidase [Bacillus sp. REN16]|uniref:anthrax toxin lethal factor-related metalloendopeptidase n=1 Tax=Bacillus sp. REN16 TaxID=2887296 RepID=UPI001E4A6F90|nr:toxin [Bacillus sp. REN16]MCC3358431.1 toxin [Bacillus sp. REN16]